MDDFRLGWSDIDILVLTKDECKIQCAETLVFLRQELLKANPKNKFYRSFEGAILSLSGFLNGVKTNVIYWGTTGERIRDEYVLDSFSMKQLVENSKLVYGVDIRNKLKSPSYKAIYHDIFRHYQTIRVHAKKTDRSLYSFGWFLDISRCIYTLKTGEIVAKTKAGKWALKNKLCPDEKALKMALMVRKRPMRYKFKTKIMDYAETLDSAVQKYEDVLEKYLKMQCVWKF